MSYHNSSVEVTIVDLVVAHVVEELDVVDINGDLVVVPHGCSVSRPMVGADDGGRGRVAKVLLGQGERIEEEMKRWDGKGMKMILFYFFIIILIWSNLITNSSGTIIDAAFVLVQMTITDLLVIWAHITYV